MTRIRSNLVSKPITDVNGYRRTVRVRANGNSAAQPVVKKAIPHVPLMSYEEARATPVVPSAADLKRISKLPVADQIRMARRAGVAPESYGVLAASKSPHVRNELSINKNVDTRSISILVNTESKVSRFSKEADAFRAENLINAALHPNVSIPALRKIVSIKTRNQWPAKIAAKRLRGEDYFPKETINQMSTRSQVTGFWNEKDAVI